ncbi:NUDIX hydrolase [Chelatococcus sp. GCM10030263]|uniref:NUDIX hydrolase n=1 Tax=Chelatococcus sp. GCM10030263 TaxID=3273387 RepID=UPI00361D19FF
MHSTTEPRLLTLREVDLRLVDGVWPWAEANRAAIEAHWAALTAANPALFNGRVLVMRQREIDGEVMTGQVIAVDYASFLAMRDFGAPDPGTGNCFAMAALRSADGAYVLGVMGSHTANAGRVYFPAGTPDMSDVLPDGRLDLLGSVTRELAEETGITPDDVTIEEGWTAVFEGARVALMRIVRSPLSAAELVGRIERFLASEEQPELAGLKLVRRAADIDTATMPLFLQHYLRHVLA